MPRLTYIKNYETQTDTLAVSFLGHTLQCQPFSKLTKIQKSGLHSGHIPTNHLMGRLMSIRQKKDYIRAGMVNIFTRSVRLWTLQRGRLSISSKIFQMTPSLTQFASKVASTECARRVASLQDSLDILVTSTAFLLSVASILQWSVILPLSVTLLTALVIRDISWMLSRLRVQRLLRLDNSSLTGLTSTRLPNGWLSVTRSNRS